jgi:hypothetical protein
MTRSRILILLACVLVPAPARAQAVGSIAAVTMQRALQLQVDALQDRADGSGELYGRASLDIWQINAAGALDVGGWAFFCGEATTSRLSVLIDGVPSVQTEPIVTIPRFYRADVGSAYTSLCTPAGSYVPAFSGYWTLVDLAVFGAGPNSDGWHTVQVYLYSHDGKRVKSQVRTVWKAP